MAELRIVIRYNTSNAPGLPRNRAQQVANDFALSKLSRPFRYDQDFIHLPADYDSDSTKSIWILCDFNVHQRQSKINNIPTEFWKVTYDDKESA